MDRLKLAPALLAVWSILGAQGARIGPAEIPYLSPGWVILAIGLAVWLAPRGPAPTRVLAVGPLLAISFVAILLWRHTTLNPPLQLPVTTENGGALVASTLQLPERRELRRLTGERRDVAIEARGFLEVPVDGTYRFDVVCDDACEIELGHHRIEARGSRIETLELGRGVIPFRLRFQQRTGPSSLLFSWNTPSVVELLPIEYYLRGLDRAPRRRLSAHAALAALTAWWISFTIAFARIVQLLRSRSAPVVFAGAIILYGSALRLQAFLAHSGLAESDLRAGSVHEVILPWAPPYAIFNPDGAPDDPYRADVRSYLDGAAAMRSLGDFYAPSFREPLYIALSKPFLAVSGGPIGILVQSLFFSIATLVLVYAIGYRSYGAGWALILVLPIALHEWLVLEAPSGYRMSAYGFFLLAFVAATWMFRSPALAGGLGAALCLIRLSALALVVPLLAISLATLPRERRVRYGVVSGVLVLALVGPFLWSNYRSHGDPFYSVSFHTEFWLRAEGLDDGQGAVPWTRYLTDFGRGGQVVKGTFLGMTVLPLRTFWNGMRRAPLLGVAVLGVGILGLAVPRLVPLTAYVGHLLPFAYIQNFPSGEMPRFVMPAFLVLVVALPLGARLIAEHARRTPAFGLMHRALVAVSTGRGPRSRR